MLVMRARNGFLLVACMIIFENHKMKHHSENNGLKIPIFLKRQNINKFLQ